jgi:YidC/Oxa1 family membrane protein insertase
LLGPWHKYVHAIEWALRQITDFTGSFGLAIIIFTILLKTVLLPLTVKSIRSTAATQELQPKIKELQKKYGKDRAALQAETMKLYQEYDINPLAGCLPMVIQIPVFFGLYYAIRHLSHAQDAGGFLWLHALNKPDPYHILPIAAGVFQFAQTKMMRPHGSPKITDPQQQMMQTMMTFMPIMVVLFGWKFDSGPVLYWTTQSIYSVVQQWFITGWGALKDWAPFLPDLPEHRRLGHRKKPLTRSETGGQPKGFFARMQAQVIEQQQQDPKARRTGSGSRTSNGIAGAAAASDDETLKSAGAGKRARRARGGAVAADTRVSGGADNDVPASRPKTVPRRTRAASANGAQPESGPDIEIDSNGTPRRRK